MVVFFQFPNSGSGFGVPHVMHISIFRVFPVPDILHSTKPTNEQHFLTCHRAGKAIACARLWALRTCGLELCRTWCRVIFNRCHKLALLDSWFIMFHCITHTGLQYDRFIESARFGIMATLYCCATSKTERSQLFIGQLAECTMHLGIALLRIETVVAVVHCRRSSRIESSRFLHVIGSQMAGVILWWFNVMATIIENILCMWVDQMSNTGKEDDHSFNENLNLFNWFYWCLVTLLATLLWITNTA